MPHLSILNLQVPASELPLSGGGNQFNCLQIIPTLSLIRGQACYCLNQYINQLLTFLSGGGRRKFSGFETFFRAVHSEMNSLF